MIRSPKILIAGVNRVYDCSAMLHWFLHFVYLLQTPSRRIYTPQTPSVLLFTMPPTSVAHLWQIFAIRSLGLAQPLFSGTRTLEPGTVPIDTCSTCHFNKATVNQKHSITVLSTKSQRLIGSLWLFIVCYANPLQLLKGKKKERNRVV